jgi:hypothetical protein
VTSWSVEHAWRCDRHGWNTCPLTPAALRFSEQPCCPDARPIASRSIATTSRPVDSIESAEGTDAADIAVSAADGQLHARLTVA